MCIRLVGVVNFKNTNKYQKKNTNKYKKKKVFKLQTAITIRELDTSSAI